MNGFCTDRCKRPIGELHNTLNEMGAKIEYLEKGYPPLKFHPVDLKTFKRKVSIKSTNQQPIHYCPAHDRPSLPKWFGVDYDRWSDPRPCIEMTLSMMQHWYWQQVGRWYITIEPQAYPSNHLFRGGWLVSSLLLLYSSRAIAEEAELKLFWYFWMESAGWCSYRRNRNTIQHSYYPFFWSCGMKKRTIRFLPSIEWDFYQMPWSRSDRDRDVCSHRSITGVFTGLRDITHQRTDRTAAMKAELKRSMCLLSIAC